MLPGFVARIALLLTALAAPASASLLPDDPALKAQRATYRNALDALYAGELAAFEQLRGRLDDYPLALYLDYFRLTRERRFVPGDRAARFVERSAGSPVGNRFLDAYLRQAGRDGRWEDFLAAAEERPRDVTLQCYYHRAQLATGDREAAFAGAARLWVHGYSRPKACDPLFAPWLAAGGATAERVWARLGLAFEARQSSLLRYLVSLSPPALEVDAKVLARLYREPQRLERHLDAIAPARRAEALHWGLRRLARYHPLRALDAWRTRSGALPAEDPGRAGTEWRIAFQALLAQEGAAVPWIDANLATWGDDQLTAMRLRWLLAEADWPRFLAVAPALSAAERESAQWRYWRGVAREAIGEREAGRALLAAAAKERSYYGFLAAEHLDVPYAFNHRPLPPLAAAPELLAKPGLRRVGELHVLGEERDAHAEWRGVLRSEDRDARLTLAALAAAEGWYHLAIDAANEAAAHDALELRFPLAYRDVFTARARALGLPETELMAIARRESAFFPAAHSSAGARGLMQVLPATGRQVASRLGVAAPAAALYRVEDNVLIGSAYYRQLLERYGGNRVLALAAYNAGPNRVDNWRGRNLPLESWIETLPFRETRDYVKAVLAYRVLFDYLQGGAPTLFQPGERAARY
ncbi:transglycosylase SLT domain-containing protein [Pseudohaliea sp.]